MELPWLDEENPCFPSSDNALEDPDGLLAVGGNLQAQTLIDAYRNGIFPWYEEPQPILWWSPSQRAVLTPGEACVSKSLRKTLRQGNFTLTTNQAFAEVINACAAPRAKARGTWITATMKAAYRRLHQLGVAHSVECWHDGTLIGGLYGVQTGAIFCGESMFSRESNASKIAFVCLSSTLADKGFALIDCQLENPHLTSLGASIISREQLLLQLARWRDVGINWPESEDFHKSFCSFRGS